MPPGARLCKAGRSRWAGAARGGAALGGHPGSVAGGTLAALVTAAALLLGYRPRMR